MKNNDFSDLDLKKVSQEEPEKNLNKKGFASADVVELGATSGFFGTSSWHVDEEGTLHFSEGNFKNVQLKTDNLNNLKNITPWSGRNYIKRIVFDGPIKFSSISVGIFSNLPNLTEIENLELLDISDVEDLSYMFSGDHKLSSVKGTSDWSTSNVKNLSGIFKDCFNLSNIDILNWDTSFVENMSDMFKNAKKLDKIDLSNFNTYNVKNMSGMFHGTNFSEIDISNFDTSNVTNMSYMFSDNDQLMSLDLSNFNTSSVLNMKSMFDGDTKLKSINVSNFSTSLVSDMSGMFNETNNLLSLDVSGFDTSRVTNMSKMFNKSKSIYNDPGVSSFNTMNVVDMSEMFSFTKNLDSMDLSQWNVSNLRNAYSMFYGTGLRNLNLKGWSVKNCNVENMFADASSLESLDLSGFRINGSDANMLNMLNGLRSINQITLGSDFKFIVSSEQNGLLTAGFENSSNHFWIAINGGTRENPKGERIYTGKSLAYGYDGNTMSDTYIKFPINRTIFNVYPEVTLEKGSSWSLDYGIINAYRSDGSSVSTREMNISGSVDTSNVGKYNVTYSFSDYSNGAGDDGNLEQIFKKTVIFNVVPSTKEKQNDSIQILNKESAKVKEIIKEDTTLTSIEKQQQYESVDITLNSYISKIYNVFTTDEINKLCELGKVTINNQHEPGESISDQKSNAESFINRAVKSVSYEINSDMTLTNIEKQMQFDQVNKVLKSFNNLLNESETPEDINKVVSDFQVLIRNQHKSGKSFVEQQKEARYGIEQALSNVSKIINEDITLTNDEKKKQCIKVKKMSESIFENISSSKTPEEIHGISANGQLSIGDGHTMGKPLNEQKSDAISKLNEYVQTVRNEINEDTMISDLDKQNQSSVLNRLANGFHDIVEKCKNAEDIRTLLNNEKKNIYGQHRSVVNNNSVELNSGLNNFINKDSLINMKVFASKSLKMYNSTDFSPANTLTSFSNYEITGYPLFKVNDVAYDSFGNKRYKVTRIDYNGDIMTGSQGYVSGESGLLSPLYYLPTDYVRKIQVIAKDGIYSYSNPRLENKMSFYASDTVLDVLSILEINSSYCVQLSNGEYIPANRLLIKKI
ncbi:BspA family leucine-rich repeat surface protein [Apilactobacillus sp. TMW 2.2459]|uniref:BspA family leucine-rich repeat surface protein n=1 Tax=Apilactobacillus xinyiensis TaxID=2841032 RepID=UPI001C7D8B67|nr:BspA family leucine-rich repeat surface protein [Apilactobacillus xinyiensis]MCL0312173.1 BspA family leucine-rich repeat surface protein [Apilactobacillus xinyiensis]